MQKIAENIIEVLKSFKEVKAVALGGSHIYNSADKYSDVDIYVFYQGKITADKERKMKLHKLDKFEKAVSKGIIDYFIFNDLHIHTWWENIDDMRKKLKNEEDVGTKTLVLYPKIVWDKDGMLKKLRRSVKFSDKLTQKIINNSLRMVPKIFRDGVEKSIRRERLYFAEWMISTYTEGVIKAIYALNKKYYNGYPNHLQFDFKRFRLVPKKALENINKIGRYSLADSPELKLTALSELYWSTVDLVRKKYKFSTKGIFPEYEDRQWYKKRISEISRLIKDTKL